MRVLDLYIEDASAFYVVNEGEQPIIDGAAHLPTPEALDHLLARLRVSAGAEYVVLAPGADEALNAAAVAWCREQKMMVIVADRDVDVPSFVDGADNADDDYSGFGPPVVIDVTRREPALARPSIATLSLWTRPCAGFSFA